MFSFFLLPSFLTIASRKPVPSKNPITRHGSSSTSSSFPFVSERVWFCDTNSQRISLRTFVTKRFIQNTKSFYLTFQTHLFPICLALEVGDLYVRNPRDVPVCSFMSFTPTYMLLIPLFPSLLCYSGEHISQLLRISFSRYYMSLG